MDDMRKIEDFSDRLDSEDDEKDKPIEGSKRKFVPPTLVKHGDFNDLTKTGSAQIFSP